MDEVGHPSAVATLGVGGVDRARAVVAAAPALIWPCGRLASLSIARGVVVDAKSVGPVLLRQLKALASAFATAQRDGCKVGLDLG
jgi:hypothetical protein